MSFTTNPHRRRLASTTTSATVAVDCHQQVRSWRLLRTIVQLLLPSCYCTIVDPSDIQEDKSSHRHIKPRTSSASSTTTNSTFTGTIFGFRRGKVNFCIQATNSKTLNPIIVLLELTVPTKVLAREMRGGVLRIALESNNDDGYVSHEDFSSTSLLTTPLWNMFCNGRKVGFAIKREPSKAELAALKVLTPVAEGAGVVNGEEINRDKSDHMMYLRASFKRVFGSFDSESFHLVDPRGIIGQELSIFFFRSSKK
ncbi:PREDICTED: protein MIZU-KUSSEI 1-like [Camelina sativa]|uniref:Protein MIZU-KUSSEI 1-like n=1 Tax=Camelina sativa TaxID=90675 RepID=A0ABM0VYQ2_CAMSA|nr:PREDICTED: protein MIZU-KUSSEI 1-like [Camelina sativa]